MNVILILVFFILMASKLFKVYEIPTGVAENVEQSHLILKIEERELSLSRGKDKAFKRIGLLPNGKYNLDSLHSAILEFKKDHPEEETIVLNPVADLNYEDIIAIMDAVRSPKAGDAPIVKKNKDGIKEKVKLLFGQILFSNLMG